MNEIEFLQRLRRLPLHPGAQGLLDDAAVLGDLVITTDTLVEGIHFLPADPPDSVAWKLVAVNLSDIAAKGATPEGVLLNYPLTNGAWDQAFLIGLERVLTRFDTPLLGGDTVSLPPGAARVLTLTALGRSTAVRPRADARPGDALWVTGMVGDAGAGLAIAAGERRAGVSDEAHQALLAAYRTPHPRLDLARELASSAHAMADVSDGLLIDAARMAAASQLAVTIDIDAVPLSPALRAWGSDPLAAATAGDDYQLLAALPADAQPAGATRIGSFASGEGLTLMRAGAPVPLPPTLGWLHRP